MEVEFQSILEQNPLHSRTLDFVVSESCSELVLSYEA